MYKSRRVTQLFVHSMIYIYILSRDLVNFPDFVCFKEIFCRNDCILADFRWTRMNSLDFACFCKLSCRIFEISFGIIEIQRKSEWFHCNDKSKIHSTTMLFTHFQGLASGFLFARIIPPVASRTKYLNVSANRSFLIFHKKFVIIFIESKRKALLLNILYLGGFLWRIPISLLIFLTDWMPKVRHIWITTSPESWWKSSSSAAPKWTR